MTKKKVEPKWQRKLLVQAAAFFFLCSPHLEALCAPIGSKSPTKITAECGREEELCVPLPLK